MTNPTETPPTRADNSQPEVPPEVLVCRIESELAKLKPLPNVPCDPECIVGADGPELNIP